ncbi:MAG: PQQ-dependent sugar dehydrogenase [Nitrospinales bacterium]
MNHKPYPQIVVIQKKHLKRIACLCLLHILAVGCGIGCAEEIVPQLKFPDDIQVTLFANVPKARHMAFDDQGTLFLSQTRKGKVVALPDANRDGQADKTVVILKRRKMPHGLAFVQLDSGYYLYVAEERQVVRLKREAKPFTYGSEEVVVSGIPGGGHFTRTIKIKDKRLYLSVGSSCNVCVEDNPIRAAISWFDLEKKKGGLFASGLRNTVGMEFSPYTGELWGVNNGRDWLGDDHPREELNIIREGRHYGWPYCYEDQKPDPEFGGQYDCAKTEPPARAFTAHMAPLGMAFYQSGSLPAQYNHSLFIAFHGSWNRSDPAGYKVARVILNEKGDILSHEDFISGWLRQGGSKLGRPVDLELSPAGDLYLSDDHAGVVYLIRGR